MDPWLNALKVLVITVPVFAMIGLGVLLRAVGLLNDSARAFLARFVYLLSLPILIFTGIAGQDFGRLLNVGLISSTLATTLVGLGLFYFLARRQNPPCRTMVAVSPWWGNVAYMGFPLSASAYGQAGLGFAGIVNAFTMPVFILLGVWLLTKDRQAKQSWLGVLKQALWNPIVVAAWGGIGVSALLTHVWPALAGSEGWVSGAQQHPAGVALWQILARTAGMIGQMGLPLALLAIGASLRLSAVHGSWRWLSVGALGKLVFGPLMTLAVCRLIFPAMDPAAVGTAVILMGCPLAASSVVIAQRLDAPDELMAALLVVSTAGACITVPAMLYLINL